MTTRPTLCPLPAAAERGRAHSRCIRSWTPTWLLLLAGLQPDCCSWLTHTSPMPMLAHAPPPAHSGPSLPACPGPHRISSSRCYHEGTGRLGRGFSAPPHSIQQPRKGQINGISVCFQGLAGKRQNFHVKLKQGRLRKQGGISRAQLRSSVAARGARRRKKAATSDKIMHGGGGGSAQVSYQKWGGLVYMG